MERKEGGRKSREGGRGGRQRREKRREGGREGGREGRWKGGRKGGREEARKGEVQLEQEHDGRKVGMGDTIQVYTSELINT